MKNWQKERNYRRIKDKEGNVLANIITVDGVDVVVSDEVYLAYSSMERRERYHDEAKADQGFLSLDEMADDDMKLEYVCSHTSISCEDTILKVIEVDERERQIEIVRKALCELPDSDRELITALFVKGMGIRQYAKHIGVFDRAVRKRRDRILREINFLEKSQK